MPQVRRAEQSLQRRFPATALGLRRTQCTAPQVLSTLGLWIWTLANAMARARGRAVSEPCVAKSLKSFAGGTQNVYSGQWARRGTRADG